MCGLHNDPTVQGVAHKLCCGTVRAQGKRESGEKWEGASAIRMSADMDLLFFSRFRFERKTTGASWVTWRREGEGGLRRCTSATSHVPGQCHWHVCAKGALHAMPPRCVGVAGASPQCQWGLPNARGARRGGAAQAR